jgi:hypothetical protein
MSLSVLSNSVVIAASLAVVVLVLNILSGSGSSFSDYGEIGLITKLVLFTTGRRVLLDKVRGPPFDYPLERLGGDRVSLVVRPDISDDGKAVAIFNKLREQGREYVWVSYSIPFIVAILLGYIVTVLFGDLVLTLIRGFF